MKSKDPTKSRRAQILNKGDLSRCPAETLSRDTQQRDPAERETQRRDLAERPSGEGCCVGWCWLAV